MWDAEVDGLNPNPPHTLESGFVTGLQGQHPIAVNAAALFRQPEGIALVMEAVRKFHGRMVPGGAKWEIWAKRTFIH